MDGGGNFRANFGVERDGVNLLAEDGSYSKGADITTGYPEFDHVLMKKLGWWDELTDAEKKAAEGKNWKTDLSGGIQRVVLKNHSCHPFGNAKARAVVWNFPDGIPQHREPLYSPRPDLVAKYPTHDDKKAFWRLPTLFKTVQQDNVAKDVAKNFPLILTSGRLVEYEGGGDETRSNPWLAELQQENFIEINPKDANDRGVRDGEYVWVKSPTGAQIKVKAMVTERVGRGDDVHPVPLLGLVAGQGHARVLSRGRGSDRAGRGRQHGHDVRLRLRDDDAGNQDDALPGRQDRANREEANMARMKFLCDAERCIECNGCVTACKQEHDIPWGVNRRRVVTINDGVPGERSISVACMHCSDAPCMAVCPVDCFYRTDDGVVLHDKDLCIGCGYCFYACPFGAPQFPQAGAFGVRGKMDKCTFCAGGPEPNNSEAEFKKYGRNRLAEGKLPVCAEMCSTKALLGGEGDVLADIYRERVTTRGKGSEVWGWATAYGRPEAPKGAPGVPGAPAAPAAPGAPAGGAKS